MEYLEKLRLSKQVGDLVKHVGAFQLAEWQNFKQSNIEHKGLHDLVSYVDKTSEKKLIDSLKLLLPNATFLAEETGSTSDVENAAYKWVIDPLDGTTNFIHHIPVFAISIALFEGEKPVFGIVYDVVQNGLFLGISGGGAFLNDKQIKVSSQIDLHQSLIATGFPYYNFSQLESYQNCCAHLMQNTRGLRRLGAAAIDLAYVAAGYFDAYFEYSLQPWDVAAGIIIVQEAGGIVTDFEGKSEIWSGKSLLACSRQLHPTLLSILNQSGLK